MIAASVAGFCLFAWCVALFSRVGRGTLAPWDPTQRLVAVGPYRYMRNPMITGVLAMMLSLLLLQIVVVAVWGVEPKGRGLEEVAAGDARFLHDTHLTHITPPPPL